MGSAVRTRLACVVLFTAIFTFTGSGAAYAAQSYAALGDSFASGVGTRSYYDSSGSCYRSPYAYPVRVANRLGLALTFVACSGARVADVRNNQLGGLSGGTRHVTVQVGGNDAGFAKVITACARPWPYTCWSEIAEAKRIIRDVLPGRLDGLYRDIRGRAGNAAVVVVGYPRLFNGEECNWGSRISPGEQAELNKVADLLSSRIKGRADAHGFAYVDARSAFTGHAVCDDAEWINGLSKPVLESYHPNRTGQDRGYTSLVAGRMAAPVPA